MHGVNRNPGKLDYSELALIINHHCSPTTEYFAKGLKSVKFSHPTCVGMRKILMIFVVRKLPN